jgi:hypothetical protein
MSEALAVAAPKDTPSSRWPWHWLIFLPVAASVVAGLTTLGIAIKHGDKPLPAAVARTGPVQYGHVLGQIQAREAGVSGSGEIEGSRVALQMQGGELPATLELRLWHPTERSRDHVIVLRAAGDGRYIGELRDPVGGYHALLAAPDGAWQIPGVWSADARGLRFVP